MSSLVRIAPANADHALMHANPQSRLLRANEVIG
jgi:hypothetical protein